MSPISPQKSLTLKTQKHPLSDALQPGQAAHYISTKQPYISAKEPYVFSEEPYISTKEPYISAKDPPST